ncbi:MULTISPECIES: S8 family peptidase [Spirosoma]|uniref:T9SS type A sorting domain-containing protein n=1 Tax=Spirosoma sordidisoli TaxID=2502893 RepID=A0A4Q2UV24_9BACT|nr:MULTISPECIES: S8 family peptidase [Spirosoma]RYC71670.1 T9SS type A sorting domain-containing protein [Spirosoma sordidisoli]
MLRPYKIVVCVVPAIRSTILFLFGLWLLASCRETLQHRNRLTGAAPKPVVHSRPQEEGNHPQVDFAHNSIALLKSHFTAYPGDGVVICQKENQFNKSDIDFTGKVRPSDRASDRMTDHATSIASMLAGLGHSSPLNEGIAPNAHLISASFNSLSPEPDEFILDNKVCLVNHSYGSSISYQYSADAAAYDEQVSRLPYLMNIFSAGNSGQDTASDGLYRGIPGFANLTGHYKMAKNVLLVGAVDAEGSVMENSSRGPAYDGRLKPELVAHSPDGTSFAAALVSGVTAILQDIHQKYYRQKAPASLLKALLINSADDLDVPGPDFKTGYGALNGYAAASALTNKLFKNGIVSNGKEVTFSLPVPANVRRMKVTLAWVDPAGNPQSLTSAALTNDLDLEVVQNKTVWQPWVLSNSAHADSLRLPARRKRDALNPVEQVTLDNPKAGIYTVRIKGNRLTSSAQSFHVCYQFDLANTLTWLYPTANTLLRSAQTTTLRWKSTYTADEGSLHYSIDQGKTWRLISSEVPLKAGQYTWEPPNLLTDCRLRLTPNGSVVPIDVRCSVSPQLEVVPQRLCADSLLLTWPSVQATTPVRYLVQQFNTRTGWATIASTDQRQVFVRPSDKAVWLAITPILSSGKAGLRSTAFSLADQPVYCYYESFDASTTNNMSANLFVTLTQTTDIAEVVFEKMTSSGEFNPVYTKPVTPDSLYYEATDATLNDGLNRYRARIRLASGAEVVTTTKEVFRFQERQPIVLYPNPINAQAAELTVMIQQPNDYTLVLYNLLGQIVLSTNLSQSTNTVGLTGLPPGLYIARIQLAGQLVQTSRLLVR